MKVFISLGLLVLVSLTTVMALDQPREQSQQLSNERTQGCKAVTRGAVTMTREIKHNCAEAYETERRRGFRARMSSKE